MCNITQSLSEHSGENTKSGYALPPTCVLEIHNPNAPEKWKKFLLTWENHALATELSKKA